MLTIATSRYFARQKVIESGLAPVRTTVGAPRFRLGYELAGSVAMLAPYGLRSIEDEAEFEAAYRARLDGFGVEKIRAALEDVARAAGVAGVVLLCFEERCTRSRSRSTSLSSTLLASFRKSLSFSQQRKGSCSTVRAAWNSARWRSHR